MFAEDVGLLPKRARGLGSFRGLLRQHRERARHLRRCCAFCGPTWTRAASAPRWPPVLRFNGKLFKGAGQDGYACRSRREQIDCLLRAARANWREVEPAIFGTLLERALDPTERHALGAHYTPRAYVERLVLPTVVEPLRADWANAQAAALVLAREAAALEGKKREAKLAEARAESSASTTSCAPPACSTRPAAAATFCM
jgi:hypothetical protein